MKWIKQVQRTRAEWKEPSGYSCVCSDHFTEDCFQPLSVVSGKLGMKMKKMLKPDAVPTLFPKPSDIPRPKSLRSSGAQEKRERESKSISCVPEVYFYTVPLRFCQ